MSFPHGTTMIETLHGAELHDERVMMLASGIWIEGGTWAPVHGAYETDRDEALEPNLGVDCALSE